MLIAYITLAAPTTLQLVPVPSIYLRGITSCFRQWTMSERADVTNKTSTSNAPYCQSFTYPEVDWIGYGCGTAYNTNWRTVSLNSSSSTPQNNTSGPTMPIVISTMSASPSPTEGITQTPPPSSSPSPSVSPNGSALPTPRPGSSGGGIQGDSPT